MGRGEVWLGDQRAGARGSRWAATNVKLIASYTIRPPRYILVPF